MPSSLNLTNIWTSMAWFEQRKITAKKHKQNFFLCVFGELRSPIFLLHFILTTKNREKHTHIEGKQDTTWHHLATLNRNIYVVSISRYIFWVLSGIRGKLISTQNLKNNSYYIRTITFHVKRLLWCPFWFALFVCFRLHNLKKSFKIF